MTLPNHCSRSFVVKGPSLQSLSRSRIHAQQGKVFSVMRTLASQGGRSGQLALTRSFDAIGIVMILRSYDFLHGSGFGHGTVNQSILISQKNLNKYSGTQIYIKLNSVPPAMIRRKLLLQLHFFKTWLSVFSTQISSQPRHVEIVLRDLSICIRICSSNHFFQGFHWEVPLQSCSFGMLWKQIMPGNHRFQKFFDTWFIGTSS